jgi:hypothetical protein
MENYYKILEQEQDAQSAELKRAIDRFEANWARRMGQDETNAQKNIELADEMRDVLLNDDKRKKYDDELNGVGDEGEPGVDLEAVYLAQAREYTNNEQHDLAKSAVDRALQHGKSIAALDLAAVVYRNNKDSQSALRYINEAILAYELQANGNFSPSLYSRKISILARLGNEAKQQSYPVAPPSEFFGEAQKTSNKAAADIDDGKADCDNQTVYRYYVYLVAFYVTWTWYSNNLIAAKKFALRALALLDQDKSEELSESCTEGFWDMGAGKGGLDFQALGIDGIGRRGLQQVVDYVDNNVANLQKELDLDINKLLPEQEAALQQARAVEKELEGRKETNSELKTNKWELGSAFWPGVVAGTILSIPGCQAQGVFDRNGNSEAGILTLLICIAACLAIAFIAVFTHDTIVKQTLADREDIGDKLSKQRGVISDITQKIRSIETQISEDLGLLEHRYDVDYQGRVPDGLSVPTPPPNRGTLK